MPFFRRTKPNILGVLDNVEGGVLQGWAVDGDHPDAPLSVTLRHNGREIAQVTANQFREDLRRAGIGNGSGAYAFFWPVPDALRAQPRYAISAHIDSFELQNSPLTVTGKPPFSTTGLDLRDFLTEQYLAGEGLEIGALHRPARLAPGATVRYIDSLDTATLQQRYPEATRGHHLVNVDIVADAHTLDPIPDNTVDFVAAIQVFEHLENPLLALRSLLRVLRPNGVLFLSIPDKRFTFDAPRPVTPFDQLLRDYTEGPEWSREEHYREWLSLNENTRAPEVLAEHLNYLLHHDRHPIHFHVWTQSGMLDLFLQAPAVLNVTYEIDCMKANGYEMIFVLRKH